MNRKFINNEIAHVGQIREEYLKRMTSQEVSLRYDWRYCPDCHYFFLLPHSVDDCDKLDRMENPIVWIDGNPFLWEQTFADDVTSVESVLEQEAA